MSRVLDALRAEYQDRCEARCSHARDHAHVPPDADIIMQKIRLQRAIYTALERLSVAEGYGLSAARAYVLSNGRLDPREP